MYGMEALPVSSTDMQLLNLSYSRAFMKIFSSYDNYVIKQCQFFTGCLPIHYLHDLRRTKFLLKLIENENELLRRASDSAKNELNDILRFYDCNVINYCASKQAIWSKFEKSVFIEAA